MLDSTLLFLLLLTACVAVLYSSVGHGGASGYLAAMSLVGVAPAEMKPTALILNVLVAGIAFARAARSNQVAWHVLLPFVIGSIPFAFIGGASTTPEAIYKRILGAVLVVAAFRMVWKGAGEDSVRKVPVWLAVGCGAAIGYISGLIGVGGGIFLSPVLIAFGWATTRQTIGIAAAFILVNSAAGLAGMAASLQTIPSQALWLAPSAFLGAIVGTELGSKKLRVESIRYLLASVLMVAAIKALAL